MFEDNKTVNLYRNDQDSLIICEKSYEHTRFLTERGANTGNADNKIGLFFEIRMIVLCEKLTLKGVGLNIS